MGSTVTALLIVVAITERARTTVTKDGGRQQGDFQQVDILGACVHESVLVVVSGDNKLLYKPYKTS